MAGYYACLQRFYFLFAFVIAIFDLVHDVEAIYGLCLEIFSFTYFSEKNLQMLLAVNEVER